MLLARDPVEYETTAIESASLRGILEHCSGREVKGSGNIFTHEIIVLSLGDSNMIEKVGTEVDILM